ncbi:hypothetical protein KUCAC02_001820 [Chaenocephalus aceratus]|uniref:Uncharacterized protein n=1 Tax=Chaenocephalus aceratus TaxID=36190 RepID=A0ACB9XRR8_CHAAC|nr:hypothetical protein KUCAC02_001820 [Chaenocephalus aceratus]
MPGIYLDRRNKWLAAIRRDHWQPTSNSRLCSQHFVSGRNNDNPMSPDYIPSLFAYSTSAGQRQGSIYATSRFEHTQQMKRIRTRLWFLIVTMRLWHLPAPVMPLGLTSP